MNRRNFLAGTVALAFLGKAPGGWAAPEVEVAQVVPVVYESEATLTTLNAMLKTYYIGPVVAQLNSDVLMLSRLDKSDLCHGTYSLSQGYKQTL